MNKLSNKTIAIGDSYNDLNMLKEARFGILFKSTKKIISENKNFSIATPTVTLLNIINIKHKEWSKNMLNRRNFLLNLFAGSVIYNKNNTVYSHEMFLNQ